MPCSSPEFVESSPQFQATGFSGRSLHEWTVREADRCDVPHSPPRLLWRLGCPGCHVRYCLLTITHVIVQDSSWSCNLMHLKYVGNCLALYCFPLASTSRSRLVVASQSPCWVLVGLGCHTCDTRPRKSIVTCRAPVALEMGISRKKPLPCPGSPSYR